MARVSLLVVGLIILWVVIEYHAIASAASYHSDYAQATSYGPLTVPIPQWLEPPPLGLAQTIW